MAFNWTCPFCNLPQVVTSLKDSVKRFAFDLSGAAEGDLGLIAQAISCSNEVCQKTTIFVYVITASRYASGQVFIPDDAEIILSRRITPESSAKPQPDFIPEAIREDYYEACKIRDLSPKASATLARRCIQGMIRDFAGVKGRTLFDEISSLKKMVEEDRAPRGVTTESVEAIDHVRSIGNIGAHMEKEIDRIISVDAGEAQVLIDLIESLFEDWYVESRKRKDCFLAINQIAAEKAALKLPKPTGEAS